MNMGRQTGLRSTAIARADHADGPRRPSEQQRTRVTHTQSTIISLLGSKWCGHLIEILDERGIARFGELQQALPGLGAKTLTISLRRLETAGLVLRTAYPEVPPRVEYELTAVGREASRRLRDITGWVATHFAAG